MSPSTLLFSLLVVALVIAHSGIHKVEEGHVGVYWRGGALLREVSPPGYHLKLPLVTRFENIQTTMQTDSVTNIPCGTSGGTIINFGKIEVVNRLRVDHVYATIKNYGIHYDKLWIYDKIHHEINQFCSQHTLQEVYIDLFDTLDDALAKALQNDCDKYDTGIEIIAVRVTKPKIPESIKKNYELVESEKTRLMVAEQTQKVIEKEAETERKRATIEATKLAEVSKIEMSRQIAQKEANQKIQAIEDQMHLARQKAQADAEYYRIMKEAEANKFKLTEEFLKLEQIRSIAKNAKIYFGESIPNMFYDPTLATSSKGSQQQQQQQQQQHVGGGGGGGGGDDDGGVTPEP